MNWSKKELLVLSALLGIPSLVLIGGLVFSKYGPQPKLAPLKEERADPAAIAQSVEQGGGAGQRASASPPPQRTPTRVATQPTHPTPASDSSMSHSWTLPAAEGLNAHDREIVELTVNDTATLAPGLRIERNAVTFSPRASTLLVPGKLKDKLCLQTVSVRDGTVTTIDLPLRDPQGVLSLLVPLPGRRAFLACWKTDRVPNTHPSCVSLVDLDAQTERPLTSLDIQPFVVDYDRRATVSGDGNQVLVQGVAANQVNVFELADLSADRQLLKKSENYNGFSGPCFTPDGRRFILKWNSSMEKVTYNWNRNQTTRQPVPSTLQLYDAGTKRLLAEHTPAAPVWKLALSGDGKTLVYSNQDKLYTVEFQSAFHLDPLPPASPAADAVLAAR